MIQKLKKEKVFYVSIISLLLILLLALFNIDAFAKSTKNILNFLLDRFSWFYILVMLSFFYFFVCGQPLVNMEN